MRHTLHAVLALAVLSLATPTIAGPWPNQRRDAEHTANDPGEVLDPSRLVVDWERQVNNVSGSFWSVPVISGHSVLVGARTTAGAFLRSYSLADGALIWERPIKSSFLPFGPAIAGDRVLVGTGVPGVRVEAYSLRAGDFLWASEPAWNEVLATAPVVKGSRFYFATNGGTHAYDARDGTSVWHSAGVGSYAVPAVGDDGLVFVSSPGHHVALRSTDGRLVWHVWFSVSGGGGTAPTVGPYVYVADRDWDAPLYPPTIFALDRRSGVQVWKRSFENAPLLSEMALSSDALLFTDGRRLRALDPGTGEDVWTFEPDTPLTRAPVIAGDYLFVSSWTRTYAVRMSTRSLAWSANVGGNVVVGSGCVLISEYSGVLHAYRDPMSPIEGSDPSLDPIDGP